MKPTSLPLISIRKQKKLKYTDLNLEELRPIQWSNLKFDKAYRLEFNVSNGYYTVKETSGKRN